MSLVIIVENTLPPESAGLEIQNWRSEIRGDCAIVRPRMPRNNQGSEVSPDQNNFFADPYHFYTSEKNSSQTTAGPQFPSNSCSSVLITYGTSLPCTDFSTH